MLAKGWVVLMFAIAITGTIGNIFIVGAVCFFPRLRVRGNAFIVNLAIADLFITVYIMPIGLVTSRVGKNPFGHILCDINAFLIMTSCGASTQSLMMIALERYIHICKPIWYPKLFQTKAVGVYIALTWIFTIIWTCQGWTGWTDFAYGEDAYICLFSGTVSLSYDLCLAFFGMVLPLLVLIFCYINIFRTATRSSLTMASHMLSLTDIECRDPSLLASLAHQKKKLRWEARFVFTMFIIVMVFAVCWIPAGIVLVLSGSRSTVPPILITTATWAALCNSSMNSFVYGALNKNFRSGYLLFFRKLFCCTFQATLVRELREHKPRTNQDSSSNQISRLNKARKK